jgi:DNA-binding IclR family transcriptional regulator
VETKAREWLTVPEVAENLKIPRSRAYELVHALRAGGLLL